MSSEKYNEKNLLPSSKLKITCVQTVSVPSDFIRNVSIAKKMLNHAVHEKPDVIFLPELWSSGYDSNLEKMRSFCKENEKLSGELSEFAAKHNVYLAAGTFITQQNGKYYNRMFIFDKKGKLINTYDKMHLFEAFGEKELFERGVEPVIIEVRGWRIGVMTCYDLRFPCLARYYFKNECSLIAVPSQWPGIRRNHWEILLRARAIENQCFVAGINTSGNADEKRLFGNSMIIDPWGEIIDETTQVAGLVSAVLDPEMIRIAKRKIPVRKDLHPFFH